MEEIKKCPECGNNLHHWTGIIKRGPRKGQPYENYKCSPPCEYIKWIDQVKDPDAGTKKIVAIGDNEQYIKNKLADIELKVDYIVGYINDRKENKQS